MAVSAKICGVTRPSDAAVAFAAGATYVGVVLVPGGPRALTAAAAQAVRREVLPGRLAAVVAETDADAVLRLRDDVGFDIVQLHGGGSEALEARLQAAGLEVWRVERLSAAPFVPRALGAASALLIEPRIEGRLGGTGTPLPLQHAAAVRRAMPTARLVLAGGLTPETVAAAVAVVAPDVVDVSSGVESRPGIKDPARVSRFLEAIRG